MGSVDTAGIYFRGGDFFSSSHCGETSLLSDSPLSDTYVGTLAEKKPMNSPLAAGALPQDWKHQYFEIGWKQASLGSAAAALRGCAAVFCLPLCSSQGQLSPINVFSVLWGIAECGRTTANETKSCDFFLKGEQSRCQIACAVTFSLAADVQIKSFPDYREGGLYLKKADPPDTTSPVHLCFPPQTGPSIEWSVNVGGSLSPGWGATRMRRGGGVRGLLATSLGLIGGFWPEKGGTSVAVAVPRLSMWQPHWWDQLFWVQRTVITSSPSVGGVFFFSPPLYIPPPSSPLGVLIACVV